MPALVCLFLLAIGSAERRCQAIAEAGGAAACVAVLTGPCNEETKFHAAAVLSSLAVTGQSAAVIAADPSSAVEAKLRWLLPRYQSPDDRREAAAALRILAAARQAAAAADAPAPPRVCAAPGCGATEGSLNRCGGCGTVRYCGEACQAAHWPEHRRQCRRVRAERAAAEAAAAGSSSEAGPSQR